MILEETGIQDGREAWLREDRYVHVPAESSVHACWAIADHRHMIPVFEAVDFQGGSVARIMFLYAEPAVTKGSVGKSPLRPTRTRACPRSVS